MNGRFGREMTARQNKAIAALLTARSIREAARAVGVGERTMRRWSRDEAFRRAYREASHEALAATIAQLRAASGEALRTLRAALDAEGEGVRVRAAIAVLQLAVGVEVDDLAARVEALEHRAPEAQET